MMYRSYHADREPDESGEQPAASRRGSRRRTGGEKAAVPKKPQKTALIAAVDLLARQEQSEQKLREKLLRKGYEEPEIAAALERLKARHYLNDEDACRRQFRFLYEESRNSVRQICLKLVQRGFDKDLVLSCVPRDTYEREKAAALRVLSLKSGREDRQKLLAALFRKGFDLRAGRAAVEEYLAGLPEEN